MNTEHFNFTTNNKIQHYYNPIDCQYTITEYQSFNKFNPSTHSTHYKAHGFRTTYYNIKYETIKEFHIMNSEQLLTVLTHIFYE